MVDIMRSPFSRVFSIENRAGPANAPEYQGRARIGDVSKNYGGITLIYVPSQARYGEFDAVDRTRAASDPVTSSLQARLPITVSDLLLLANRRCPIDIQVHVGICEDPRDFNAGWLSGHVMVFEDVAITNHGIGNYGALSPEQDSPTDENVDFSALRHYQMKSLQMSEIGATEIVQEIIDTIICDAISCGACGLASNGCQVFFALTLSAGGSPGLPAELIFSQDGGATIGQTNVSTLAANEDPNKMACVGTYLIVVSEDSESLHYAPIADILAGTETWTEVATGFVAAKGPKAIFSLSSVHTWIVGEGGYVYFTDDPTAGVDVQDAGVATTEDLNDIHGVDTDYLVAVGNNNAVIKTANGGATWQAVTGPAAGVVLNCVWMRTKDEWFVGTAGGELWYTRDAGETWTEKAFSGTGGGQVRDIQFATPTRGFMAHDTAAVVGRILETIDGGFSWRVLPRGTGSIPTNDKINAIAACEDDPNIFYAGGLGANGVDGILLKGA